VVLSRIFLQAGLPIAEIFEVFPDPGCLFVEDLGSVTLEDALAAISPIPDSTGPEHASRLSLYLNAVELAVWVAERGTLALASSDRALGPALDSERFAFEMDFFVTHYLRGYLGVEVELQSVERALRELAAAAANTPHSVLCHRDYHSRNLMVRPNGPLAMVDIQDARWGPDTYDLASLLFDAYVDIPASLVEELLGTFLRSRSDLGDQAAFRARFQAVSAQRMIKALGTFGYQLAALGHDRYRSAVPRTLRRLEILLPSFSLGATVDDTFRRLDLYRRDPVREG